MYGESYDYARITAIMPHNNYKRNNSKRYDREKKKFAEILAEKKDENLSSNGGDSHINVRS